MRALLLAFFLVAAGCLRGPEGPTASTTPPAPPTVELDVLVLETEEGRIEAVFYDSFAGEAVAPQTVALMRAYVEERYYHGREFGRVVPGHVIQVTDKVFGATDDPRRVPLEVHERFDFSAGALGIGRDEDPNSGGPQFFIADFATSHLYQGFTVWGQVIQGMDVVRRIARGEAVEVPRPPPQVPYLADRVAVDAVAITGTRIERRELSADVVAALPVQVAKNVRAGEFRYGLEWPADLAPGSPRTLTWFMRPYNGTAPPAAEAVRIVIGGVEHPVTGDETAAGVYHWTWAPASNGTFDATLTFGGSSLATLQVCVPETCEKPVFKWR